MAYYETVALLIAIIVLALAFEARAFEEAGTGGIDDRGSFSAITMLMVLVLLSVGELAALFSLAEGRDTGLAKGVTAVAVVSGGVGVIAPLWSRHLQAARGADRSTWLDAFVLVVGLGVGVVALVALLMA